MPTSQSPFEEMRPNKMWKFFGSILAAIFETAGAILMGSHVTNTIRKGIANYKLIQILYLYFINIFCL